VGKRTSQRIPEKKEKKAERVSTEVRVHGREKKSGSRKKYGEKIKGRDEGRSKGLS